jgi:HEAT repeat protein
MSTETSPSQPNTVSKVISSETRSQHEVLPAATHADKPPAADKIAAEPVAHPKAKALQVSLAGAQGPQSLLDELASPEPGQRAKAAEALGRLADVAAVPALIAALNDTDADVAREAAASLGLLRGPAAVEPLIDVLNNRDGYFHVVVRIAATHSLGQLRDHRAVEPLLDAIRDPIAEASAEAIRALASLSDPRTLPAFLEVVRNEHGFFLATTRLAAILGLAQIGGEQAACELRFVAANQWEDAVIRAAAIELNRPTPTQK